MFCSFSLCPTIWLCTSINKIKLNETIHFLFTVSKSPIGLRDVLESSVYKTQAVKKPFNKCSDFGRLKCAMGEHLDNRSFVNIHWVFSDPYNYLSHLWTPEDNNCTAIIRVVHKKMNKLIHVETRTKLICLLLKSSRTNTVKRLNNLRRKDTQFCSVQPGNKTHKSILYLLSLKTL